jgi:predicted nucleic acid-binding protein
VSAAFIIDCSITMAWCFADEATPKAAEVLDRLEQESALVPSLWFLEVVNVLAAAEKRKRISAKASDDFVRLLHTFDIEVEDEVSERAFGTLLPLCREQKLTSYDAVYLDLASRRGVPLASLDDDLRRAAKALRIAVLGK